jgi:cell division septation protein DedD
MDKVLKQRLVGASILIALAVIFLPMLFDGDDAPGEDRRQMAIDVPDREAGERRVRRLALDPEAARQPPADTQAQPPARPDPAEARPPRPVEAQPRESAVEERQDTTSPTQEPPTERRAAPSEDQSGTDASSSEAEPAAETLADTPPAEEPAVAETQPEAETESDTAPEPAAEAAPPPAAAAGNWVVQVAVFSSRDTAASIRQRLIDLGHRVSMDVLVRDQAELFRLRTGPYASEGDAERARGQIAATVAGVQPVARELSGDAGGDDRSGLVVQVGSFASNNNAERLVGQLTGAGFDAFMYGEESGGRTIWRVRVGGYDTREEAERLLETLRREQGLDGIVVSHP